MTNSPTTPPKRGGSCLLIAVAVPVLLVASCTVAMLASGGGAGGELLPTEAQVACERGVRGEVGGSPTFNHGLTSEVSGGFEVLGRGSVDGLDFGYACTVTGPSGHHRTQVQITS